MGISWQDVEDACAENRELAGIIRELGRLHGGGPSIDWAEPRGSGVVRFAKSAGQHGAGGMEQGGQGAVGE